MTPTDAQQINNALRAALDDAALTLDMRAEQLDRWAAEAEAGGWGEAQADAQRRAAEVFRGVAEGYRAVARASMP